MQYIIFVFAHFINKCSNKFLEHGVLDERGLLEMWSKKKKPVKIKNVILKPKVRKDVPGM